MARGSLVRRFIAWTMTTIIVVSVVYWSVTHERRWSSRRERSIRSFAG